MPCASKDLQLRPEWVLTREAREKALARRHKSCGDDLLAGTKTLNELVAGSAVQVQNQTGPHAGKWDLSGKVVEVTATIVTW